jgi:hypothetical protein
MKHILNTEDNLREEKYETKITEISNRIKSKNTRVIKIY